MEEGEVKLGEMLGTVRVLEIERERRRALKIEK